MDSGRLELDTKSLRNFNKIYAFRPEPNLELFQVQIRTDLYIGNKLDWKHLFRLETKNVHWKQDMDHIILHIYII